MAWELLIAMLLMEAACLPGVIAAPIYNASLKSELVAEKLV